MILCSLRVESGNDMSLIEYERTLENTYKKKTAWNHFQAVSYLKFVIFNVERRFALFGYPTIFVLYLLLIPY